MAQKGGTQQAPGRRAALTAGVGPRRGAAGWTLKSTRTTQPRKTPGATLSPPPRALPTSTMRFCDGCQRILFCDGCQRNSFPSAMVVSAVHSLLRWLSAQCIPFPAHSRSALTDAWGAQGVARRAHAGAVRPRRFPRVPQGVALTYTLTPPPFSLPPTACPTGPNPRVPQGAALRPRRRRARRNRRARLARNAVAGRGCRRGHRVIPLGP